MLVWKSRKAAFAAIGRISPNILCRSDGVRHAIREPHAKGEERDRATQHRNGDFASPTSSMPATAISIPVITTAASR